MRRSSKNIAANLGLRTRTAPGGASRYIRAMATESIALPSESVASAAHVMARRLRLWAILPFVTAAFFALGLVASVSRHGPKNGIDTVIFGALFMIGGPIWIAVALRMRASRIVQVGQLALADRGLRWHVAGKQLVAVNERDAPRADLAFGVSASVRQRLLVRPAAVGQRTSES